MYEKVAFTVSGVVQGVCFRAYAQGAARDLDVTGWVRNRDDGRVEGEAWGERDALEGFIHWLQKGPPHGRVDHVDIDRLEPEADRPAGFRVRY
jgi:acylphosphatase